MGHVKTDNANQAIAYNSQNLLTYGSPDGQSVVIDIKNLNTVKTKNFIKCWVCEGWREEKFTVTQGESIHGRIEEPVFIHFEFDNWKPTVVALK